MEYIQLGQLGIGNTKNTLTAKPVPHTSSFTSISAKDDTSAAITGIFNNIEIIL